MVAKPVIATAVAIRVIRVDYEMVLARNVKQSRDINIPDSKIRGSLKQHGADNNSIRIDARVPQKTVWKKIHVLSGVNRRQNDSARIEPQICGRSIQSSRFF